MSRRLNFTGRRRIHRSHLGVEVERSDETLLVSVTQLEIDDLGLPPDAQIYLEIYHQTFYHRIHCGSVGTPSVPNKSSIEDFAAPELLKCRVLVVASSASVDGGKVLAQADRVPVSVLGDTGSAKGLLPVEPGDLGSLLWRMDVSEGPRILINESVDWKAAAKGDWFRALVFPEALRRAYLWTVGQLRIGADDDELLAGWVQYFEERLGLSIRDDAEDDDLELEASADEATAKFADAMNLHKTWPAELTGEDYSV